MSSASERGYEEGRRAGLLEAAEILEDRRAQAERHGFEKEVLLLAEEIRGLRALAGPAQTRLDGGEDPPPPGDGDELNQRAWICMIAHLQARQKFFQEERGHYQPPTPAALAEAKKEIRAALIRHGETNGDREKWRRESAVLAAGIGIFYAPHLNGELEREKELKRLAVRKLPAGWLPKLYLELWRPWKCQRGKADPVPGFAELCFERRREAAR